jgi:uncharacterized cupin superfamily protein
MSPTSMQAHKRIREEATNVKRRSISYRGTCLAVVLGVALGASSPAAGEDNKVETKAAPIPVRMNPDKLAGVALPPSEPFIAPDDILEGSHRPRGEILYQGEELVMEIYEDNAATYAISDPNPFDEFVQVLSGKLILTDSRGTVHEYLPGDSLVVPKGFTGIWKMLGNYRELIAVERTAYERAFGPLPSGENADPAGK